MALIISSQLVWITASNSKAQKDVGPEGGIVLSYFVSWLILKVGKPSQADLSCSRVWQSLYRHRDFAWQQDPGSSASPDHGACKISGGDF